MSFKLLLPEVTWNNGKHLVWWQVAWFSYWCQQHSLEQAISTVFPHGIWGQSYLLCPHHRFVWGTSNVTSGNLLIYFLGSLNGKNVVFTGRLYKATPWSLQLFGLPKLRVFIQLPVQLTAISTHCCLLPRATHTWPGNHKIENLVPTLSYACCLNLGKAFLFSETHFLNGKMKLNLKKFVPLTHVLEWLQCF